MSKAAIRREDKREWETQYECTGCARWYHSESEADKCCGHGVYELSVCSWCGEHVDHCECEVPEHMEG